MSFLGSIEDVDLNNYEYEEQEQDPIVGLKLCKVLLAKKLLLGGVLGLLLGYGYGPQGYIRPGVNPGLRPGGRPGLRPGSPAKPYYDEEEQDPILGLKLRKVQLGKKLSFGGALGLPLLRLYERLGYGYGPYRYIRPGVNLGIRPGRGSGLGPGKPVKPYYNKEKQDPTLGLKLRKVLLGKKTLLGGALGLPFLRLYERLGYGWPIQIH